MMIIDEYFLSVNVKNEANNKILSEYDLLRTIYNAIRINDVGWFIDNIKNSTNKEKSICIDKFLSFSCDDINDFIKTYYVTFCPKVKHICTEENPIMFYAVRINRSEIAKIIFDRCPDSMLLEDTVEHINSLEVAIYNNDFYLSNLFFNYMCVSKPDILYSNYVRYYKAINQNILATDEISTLVHSYANAILY